MKRLILFLMATTMSIIAMAQVLYVKDINIVISNGALLKTNDIKTEGTATISVNGELQIVGNLINDAANTFLPADGKVLFNGAQQNISGSFPIYLPVLDISGTGKKTLEQNIFVGNTLTVTDNVLLLNNQVLQLNSKQLTILSASSDAVQRIANGFVESETNSQNGYGYLQWNIKNNTGNYIFPFGSSFANTYLPLTVAIQQAGTGTNGYIRAAIYPTDAAHTPNNRPFPAGVTNMNNISGQEAASKIADRFWIVEADNYTSKPIANLNLSYLEGEWNNSNSSTNSITEGLLTPHAWSGTQWVMATGTVQTSNNILVVSGTNFSNSVWRATQGAGALPVTLLSFTAQLNSAGNADIKWSTATEINTSRFEIEKSLSGNQFAYLKTVAAAGNSSVVLNYNEQDNQVAAGTTFYRLKMIDIDGSYKYSNIASVKKQAANEVLLYPNPAAESITISWAKPVSKNITYSIYDASGKMVMQWVVSSGNNKTTKNVRMLPVGTYILSWMADGKIINRLFIKK